jgi:peptidoglycan/xylan/chitin deacetylase (PgdA/CDA1 family)
MFKSLFSTLALFSAFVAAVPSPKPVPGFEDIPARELYKRAPAQIITQCTKPNTVALTFDDGPYLYVQTVGNAIKAAGGNATFFFNGANWGCIYDQANANNVRWAVENGHQAASHTWSHANLASMTWDQLHHQFWLMEEALMKIAGVYPAFARPPYGSYNDLVREVAGMRGQNLALWDFDSGDTWGIPTADVKQRYTDIANAHPSNILSLNHDVWQATAEQVVPHAISVLSAKGYSFVTVADCLGMPAYQWTTTPATRDSTWTCDGKPGPNGWA